jgi:2'-5' RNA ligase
LRNVDVHGMFLPSFTVCNMPDQLFLPGFERHPAFDVLFFALLLKAENASQIVRLRQRLCEEFGLSGRHIAADRLHISVHGIGAYDGLPRAVVQRAKQAGAAVLAKPFDIVLDRAMSFGPKREVRPFVLRAPATKQRSLLSIGYLVER